MAEVAYSMVVHAFGHFGRAALFLKKVIQMNNSKSS